MSRRPGRPVVISSLIVIAALSLSLLPDRAHGQEAPTCIRISDVTADLGSPSQEGTTLQPKMDQQSDVRRYVFKLPQPGTAYVYVGDQWYDLDLGVYSISEDRAVGCWRVTKDEAISQRAQSRLIQLIRPDERVIDQLTPGDYDLTVRASPYAADFDPARQFTVRVALGPPVCDLSPPNDETDPQYPQLKRRRGDDQNLYQLGLSYEPVLPGQFDLMSFNAFVSPPYTDLFDFEWLLDGQPVPDANSLTIQQPVTGLAKTADRAHTVRLTARGARQYPDPQLTHTPPTLSVECTFSTRD
jgi:hypothetical protein